MATATVVVAHIGEDYATLEVHISRPGYPGETHTIEGTELLELGKALQKVGLSYIPEDEGENDN